MSCATATFCVVAGEQSGSGVDYVTTNGGTSWSGPSSMDSTPSASVNSLSCPTANVCVAVDSAGNAISTSDGATSSSTPAAIDASALESVSCASPIFCVAVDNDGKAMIYAPPVPAGLYVSSVAPSTGLTTGDTAVTISGSGFTTYDVDNVFFGTQAATNVAEASNNTITADSPPEPAGVVDVTVATTSGTSAVNAADQFDLYSGDGPVLANVYSELLPGPLPPWPPPRCWPRAPRARRGPRLQLSVNAGTLPCPGAYDYTVAVSDLSTTAFATHATVTVTETIGDLPSTKGVRVCEAPLSASTGSFLPKCRTHVVAPCINSERAVRPRRGGGHLRRPGDDRRFRAGGEPIKVTSFTPTHGVPGFRRHHHRQEPHRCAGRRDRRRLGRRSADVDQHEAEGDRSVGGRKWAHHCHRGVGSSGIDQIVHGDLTAGWFPSMPFKGSG